MKRPLAAGCAAFASGVFFGCLLLESQYAASLGWLALICAFSAALTAAALYRVRRSARAPLLTKLTVLLIVTAALGAGLGWRWTYQRVWIAPALEHAGDMHKPDMLVTGYPSESLYGYMTPVKLYGVPAALFSNGMPDVKPGDVVTGWVNVALYGRSGYTLRASQTGPLTVEPAPSIPLTLQPARMRRALLGRMDSLFGDMSAMPKALTTGDRSGFSDSFNRALSISGLSHTTAVSGLHISFITGLMIMLLGGPRRSAMAAVPAIWLFAALVGFPDSAVRAAVMNTAVLLTPLLRRDYDGLSALGLAAALIAAFRPEAMANAGFQLSFAATLGILLFASGWRDAALNKFPFLKRYGVTRALASTSAVSLAAIVFTTPLTAYYFGRVSLIAPLSNLLMLQLLSYLFIGTLSVCGLSFLWMPGFLGKPLEWGFALCEWYVRLSARIPYASLSAQNRPAVFFLIYLYALLILCYAAWKRGVFKRAARRALTPVCAAVCALCATILSVTLFYDFTELLHLTAVDVGQGQSVIVETRGHTAVIDCGGFGANAGSAVADTLASRGRGTVDVLILSHYHADHCNGVEALIDSARVGLLVVPPERDAEETEWRGRIEDLCRQRGIEVLYADGDVSVNMGDCTLEILTYRGGGGINERCLSVLGRYGNFSFLTTGDMDTASQLRLYEAVGLPPVSLYVVGHHGSRFSSGEEFLSAVSPQAAIISAGANNFGHPTPETLQRLRDSGASVYRTDQHGGITVTVRGR
ncbi:MAG: ComEC/Rec2 family competence protein [Oscillospiraceae bacterium]|nr:ComEC/Rec2 family competence protein [Oscillospiraceae bacterium]